MVDQRKKGKKKGGKRGRKAIILAKEESSTESDNEPTPFKKVMSKKVRGLAKIFLLMLLMSQHPSRW